MLKEINCDKTLEIYQEHLGKLNDISITYRETDIIACLMHNRGEKKIAGLLLISPRTVGTHVHNIMLKLGTSSRDQLMDLIEKSGKLPFLKNYYKQLLVKSAFQDALQLVKRHINIRPSSFSYDCSKLSKETKKKFNIIKNHLKLCNINIDNTSSNVLQLSFHDKNDNNYFKQKENYYNQFFDFLKNNINSTKIQNIHQEFLDQRKIIEDSYDTNKIIKIQSEQAFQQKDASSKKNKLLVTILAIFITLITLTSYYKTKPEPKIVRPSLDLPMQNLLLERSKVMNTLKNKLNKINGIQVVALVGIGGSGKTTIAQKFALESDAPLIWKIDASSKDSFYNSLLRFAEESCDSKEDREEFAEIELSTTNPNQKLKKLSQFFKRKCRQYSNWLLIYDNVTNLKHLRLPTNPKIWGNGKIIITSRDHNIELNNKISSKNVIHINNLSEEEKLSLINKIIPSKEAKTNNLINKDCIKEIPPFPLDVSIAAHVIKSLSIKCPNYLKHSKSHNDNFTSAQKTVLSDIGKYSKTRYELIRMPTISLINSNKKYKNMLLLISMLNPDDIPKKILLNLSDELTVNNFLHDLDRFSLIKRYHSDSKEVMFSIHACTQNSIKAFFINEQNITNKPSVIDSVSNAVIAFAINNANNCDIEKIKNVIKHLKTIKKLSFNLLNNKAKTILTYKLGDSYSNLCRYKKSKESYQLSLDLNKKYFGSNIYISKILAKIANTEKKTGNYKKAERILDKALISFKNHYGDNHHQTATVLTTLGTVYKSLGKYPEALKVLDRSQSIFSRCEDCNCRDRTENNMALGETYRNLGQYQKALFYLEKTLNENKRDNTKISTIATNSAYLASVYKSVGLPKKAEKLLKESTALFKKINGDKSAEYAWSIGYLGSVYKDLDQQHVSLSIKLLKQSIEIYKSHLPDNHIIVGWVKMYLGDAYVNNNQIKLAIKYLHQSLAIHHEHYGKNHIKTGKVLNSLANAYFIYGDKINAKKTLNKAIYIYKKHGHQYIYKCFEIYCLHHLEELQNTTNTEQKKYHYIKASENLIKAKNIVATYFPKESDHLERLKEHEQKLHSLDPINPNPRDIYSK